VGTGIWGDLERARIAGAPGGHHACELDQIWAERRRRSLTAGLLLEQTLAKVEAQDPAGLS
jgi:hypothetical protein